MDHKTSLLVIALTLLVSACGGNLDQNTVQNLKPSQKQIAASDGDNRAYFGNSSAISGDGNYVIIGATFANIGWDSSQGAAYLYSWESSSGWIETKKFVASDGVASDNFGRSVSISDDGGSILIGANSSDIGIEKDNGAVYLYQWNGNVWKETQFIASDTSNGDYFGIDVDISADGETFVVGAPDDNFYKGSVYVYRWSGSTWIESKITSSDGIAPDYFGNSVAVSANGSLIAAGAYNHKVGANFGQGSAYIFKWNGSGYVENKKLTASDGASNDQFGYSVDVSCDGSVVAVGANYKDSGTTNDCGKVYLYSYYGSWIETRLTPSDAEAGDEFGRDVAVSENAEWVLVSAPMENSHLGQGYLFQRTGSTQWQEVKKMDVYDSGIWFYGTSLAISKDGADGVIGGPRGIVNSTTNQGFAYLYHW